MAPVIDHPARKARVVLDIAYPLNGGPGRIRLRFVSHREEWAAEQEITSADARRWIEATIRFVKNDAR